MSQGLKANTPAIGGKIVILLYCGLELLCSRRQRIEDHHELADFIINITQGDKSISRSPP